MAFLLAVSVIDIKLLVKDLLRSIWFFGLFGRFFSLDFLDDFLVFRYIILVLGFVWLYFSDL